MTEDDLFPPHAALTALPDPAPGVSAWLTGLVRPAAEIEALATLLSPPEHARAARFGRPDLRVIDARWRPDGTGRTQYATGHVPGATYIDWRADIVDVTEGGDALLLAAPDRLAVDRVPENELGVLARNPPDADLVPERE